LITTVGKRQSECSTNQFIMQSSIPSEVDRQQGTVQLLVEV